MTSPASVLAAAALVLAVVAVPARATCSTLAGVAIGADCADRTPPPSRPRRVAGDPAAVLLESINVDRADRGLSALVPDRAATRIAARHARAMARRGRVYHNAWLTTAEARRTLGTVSENVGLGPSALSLHTAFMRSPGHRANILDPHVRGAGLAVHRADGMLWAVEVFLMRPGRGVRPEGPRPISAVPRWMAAADDPPGAAPPTIARPRASERSTAGWLALGVAAVLAAVGLRRRFS